MRMFAGIKLFVQKSMSDFGTWVVRGTPKY